TMIIRLLNHPDLRKYDLSSLRNIGYGAAPMPVEVIRETVQVFGPILTQNYGQTEAYMTISFLPKEEHHLEGPESIRRRLASVGRPYTFVEVRIVDDQGRDIRPGERGEIIVRSEHVMQGYWKLPAETAEVLKEGWLYTGDVATVDEEGFIYLLDRKKDMIISGGFNIYPREVEEVLYTHPYVMEANPIHPAPRGRLPIQGLLPRHTGPLAHAGTDF
ncbi:MAG: AMP-binding protein, partial [Firmicutes bacterium]|nr:AMP-binding protein [Bacillota bacterium]